ncbi:MAG TPA: sulfite exporter TauE/SafE family protein [Myxococcota bacterium]
MTPFEILALGATATAAGVVNTLAGGGSLLTVPLLVLLGLPGGIANGTNRVGVLLQSWVAAWRFFALGVGGLREAAPVLLPVAAGALIGAWGISQVSDAIFERAFGIVMLLLLIPLLRELAVPRKQSQQPPSRLGPRWAVIFFAIGVYGGSFQAGVGIPLLFALSYAGFDLVRANAIKVIVTAVLTLTAVPVFILAGQIAWGPAAVLVVGYSAGAALGARLAVRGGERLIRPVLALAVIALAGRMLGLY